MLVENYRIKEYCGEYTIEREYINTVYTGFLWWRKSKKVSEWYTLSIKFDELEKAIKCVNNFKGQPKYHYL